MVEDTGKSKIQHEHATSTTNARAGAPASYNEQLSSTEIGNTVVKEQSETATILEEYSNSYKRAGGENTWTGSLNTTITRLTGMEEC